MYRLTILYILILFILTGCVVDEVINNTNNTDGGLTLTFETNISYEIPTRANSISENTISDLSVLLFDENGLFIKRAEASVTSGNDFAFTVTLPESKEKRILHFIAGYSWSSFNEESWLEKSEQELIPTLFTTQTMGFWERKELNTGIYENCLQNVTIGLMRNMARISITNNESRLTDGYFAVYNKPDRGTIAPFDTENYSFPSTSDDKIITEAYDVSYSNYDEDFLMIDDESQASFIYERSNVGSAGQVSQDALFIIIRGKYENSAIDNYYKIEIYDKESLRLLNTTRNCWYRIVITEVGYPGYETLQEALASPASNNLTASVVLEEYPSITDNEFALIVDKTALLYIKDGEKLSVGATYKEIATDIADNSKIQIYDITEQDASYPVFKTYPEYDPVTGKITADLHDIVDGRIRTGIITVRGENLLRKIKVTLASPFEFGNARFTPGVVGADVGSATQLSFNVPGTLADFLPFTCSITANGLSPTNDQVETTNTGSSWEYRYKVETTGEHTIPFQTNTPNSAEAVILDAEMFVPAYVTYTNSGNTRFNFNNVKFTPERAPFFAGNDIMLQFTVAQAGQFIIATNNLELAYPQENLTQYSNLIFLTAPAAGEYFIYLKTTKDNNGETITLTSANHATKTVDLKNELVHLHGKLTLQGGDIRYTGSSVNYNSPPRVWIGRDFIYNRYQTHLIYGLREVIGSFYTSSVRTSWGSYSTEIETEIGEIWYFALQSQSTISPTGEDNYATAKTEVIPFTVSGPDMEINGNFTISQ